MEVGEKTILIVEDDKLNQEALRISLKNKYKVETCDSEKPFFDKLSSGKIDLIIMDISLNGNKNGLELTKEIRNNLLYKNIPIICLTAHARKADEHNAFLVGVDVFITKPVNNNIVMKAIDELLKKD